MLRRLTLILTLVSVVGLLTAPAVAAARPAASDVTAPVTGTLPGDIPFSGVLTVEEIVRNGTDLFAIVDLVSSTGVTLLNDVAVPLQVGSAPACDILTLDVGAIFLDLLGLQVDVAPISIDVTAVPGAGNLLGNLLCAVA